MITTRAHLHRIIATHAPTCTCDFCGFADDALGLSRAPASSVDATVTVLRTPADCAARYGGTAEAWGQTFEELGHTVLHVTPDGVRLRRPDDDLA